MRYPDNSIGCILTCKTLLSENLEYLKGFERYQNWQPFYLIYFNLQRYVKNSYINGDINVCNFKDKHHINAFVIIPSDIVSLVDNPCGRHFDISQGVLEIFFRILQSENLKYWIYEISELAAVYLMYLNLQRYSKNSLGYQRSQF